MRRAILLEVISTAGQHHGLHEGVGMRRKTAPLRLSLAGSSLIDIVQAGAYRSPRGVDLPTLIPSQPPCLRQVQGAGYDAMVQLTSGLMRTALARDLAENHIGTETRLSLEEVLDDDQRDSLASMLAAQVHRAPVIAWPIAPTQVEVELEPRALALRLAPSRLDVAAGANPHVTISFSATLELEAVETDASFESRVDFASFRNAPPPFRDRLPVGVDPVSVKLPVATFVIRAAASVSVNVEASRYRAEARFPFPGATVTGTGSDLWRSLVVAESESMFRSWGLRSITPEVQFFGDPPSLPVPGITGFKATAIGTPSVLWRGSWLTLCFTMTPGDSASEESPIEPFTGTKNMAVFMSDPVITATVLSRWPTIPRPAVDLTLPIRVVGDDGEVARASARMRYEVGDASWATLSYGTESLEDNVAISAEVVSRALRAEFRGEDISDQLGALAEPTTHSELFRAFVGSVDTQQPFEAMDVWLQRIGAHVIIPAIKPIAERWRMGGEYQASLSASLSSLICQGDLS